MLVESGRSQRSDTFAVGLSRIDVCPQVGQANGITRCSTTVQKRGSSVVDKILQVKIGRINHLNDVHQFRIATIWLEQIV